MQAGRSMKVRYVRKSGVAFLAANMQSKGYVYESVVTAFEDAEHAETDTRCYARDPVQNSPQP